MILAVFKYVCVCFVLLHLKKLGSMSLAYRDIYFYLLPSPISMKRGINKRCIVAGYTFGLVVKMPTFHSGVPGINT